MKGRRLDIGNKSNKQSTPFLATKGPVVAATDEQPFPKIM